MSGYRRLGRNTRKELQARRIFLEPRLTVQRGELLAQRRQQRSQQRIVRRGRGR